MATMGVLFKKALPRATGGSILSWQPSKVLGKPISFSDTIPMAPVVYMPAATMNRAPMVNMPELENPRRHSSNGAKRKVITSVSAEINDRSALDRVSAQ